MVVVKVLLMLLGIAFLVERVGGFLRKVIAEKLRRSRK